MRKSSRNQLMFFSGLFIAGIYLNNYFLNGTDETSKEILENLKVEPESLPSSHCHSRDCKKFQEICKDNLNFVYGKDMKKATTYASMRASCKASDRDYVESLGHIRNAPLHSWMFKCPDDVLEQHARTFNLRQPFKNFTDWGRQNMLGNFHNPCWLATLDETYHRYKFPRRLRHQERKAHNRHSMRSSKGKPYALRCLPYFFVFGPEKAGSLDLFDALRHHPLIRMPDDHAPHFWPMTDEPYAAQLEDYVSVYDVVADKIASSLIPCDGGKPALHPIVTGDATPETFNSLHEGGERNRAAEQIAKLIPQAKIVIILRNPVHRLVAEYIASHPSTRSQENLDELLRASIPKVHECIGSLEEPHKSCLFSRRNDERHKWNTDEALKVGLYSLYLQDWLSAVGRERIMFVNHDRFVKERVKTVEDVVDFLELPPLTPEKLKVIGSLTLDEAGGNVDDVMPMFVETRAALHDFYERSNQQVLQLVRDDSFHNW